MHDASGTQRWFVPIMGILIGMAWTALLLWQQSPYGRYLDHGQWTDVGLAASICRAMPAGNLLLPGLLYAGGWVLMSAAMMLPTSLPLFRLFDRLVALRRDRNLLITLLITGYLLAWAAFGVIAHLVDAALHVAVARSDWLLFNGWVLGAGVLAIAGLFQFSSFKYHCLDKCRTPFSFIAEHWHGAAPRFGALRLGIDHGIFCVGCCWAIMLLMFVVGTGSVGWMLMVGAVMAVEKNVRWGRKLIAPLGLGLLLWSGAVVAEHVWH
jgi:predicted metal-binding membrane protein